MKNTLLIFVLLLAFNLGYAQEYIPDSNTVLLFHLNELADTSGTEIMDASGKGNNGWSYHDHTDYTSDYATVVDGRFGKARLFKHNKDMMDNIFIMYDSSLNFSRTNEFTAECWVNIENSPNLRYGGNLLSYWQTDFGLWETFQGAWKIVSRNGYLKFTVNSPLNDSSSVEAPVPIGFWIHVACVWNGNTGIQQIYVNGVVANSISNATKTIGSMPNSVLWIGTDAYPVYGFEGIVDEVRLSNRARLPQEFNLQLPPKNAVASLTADGKGSVLNWEIGGGSAPLKHYKIYRGVNPYPYYVSLIDSVTNPSYTDTSTDYGVKYYYRISAVDSSGFESVKTDTIGITPTIPIIKTKTGLNDYSNIFECGLSQNYPNPFNTNTIIQYSIQVSGPVKLRVVDILGHEQILIDENQSPGNYQIKWMAQSSGTYLAILESNGKRQTIKMVAIK
jgi:hypothetical protein